MEEKLLTEVFTENILLTNLIQELKPIILQNGGRSFEEFSTSRGDGAAYAELQFTFDQNKWEIKASTQGKRTVKREKITRRKWLRKEEQEKIFIIVEVRFSLTNLTAEFPNYIFKSLHNKNPSINKEENGISWIHILYSEEEYKQGMERRQKLSEKVIEMFQREKANMMKNAKEVLETLFEIKRSEVISREAAK